MRRRRPHLPRPLIPLLPQTPIADTLPSDAYQRKDLQALKQARVWLRHAQRARHVGGRCARPAAACFVARSAAGLGLGKQ